MISAWSRLFSLSIVLMVCACAQPLVVETPSDVPPRPRGRHHRFRVVGRAVPTRIRRDLSLAEVAALPGAARPGLHTQGLTLIKHGLSTHTRFRSTTDESKVAAWFDDVILELHLSSVTIHIPKEYREGSCESKEVLLHEKGHVEQGKRSVARAVRRLEDALATAEDLPTRKNPLTAVDFDAAAGALRDKIARLVDPIYAEYERSEAAAQAALDTPDPYDAVYRSCSGWK